MFPLKNAKFTDVICMTVWKAIQTSEKTLVTRVYQNHKHPRALVLVPGFSNLLNTCFIYSRDLSKITTSIGWTQLEATLILSLTTEKKTSYLTAFLIGSTKASIT